MLCEISTKKEVPLHVQVDEAEESENIVISAKLLENEIVSSDYNYLPASQDFRDKLLSLGYGIKCNGARLNAVQSGMMGCTDKLYLVELGRQSLKSDIAHIWEYADMEDFPNTEEQAAFYAQWFHHFTKDKTDL